MTDEREAQIRQLHSGIRNHPDIRFLLRLLDEARAEIARLRVPAEADVMERAGGVFDEVVALLFDGTRPKPYLRPDAIIPIAAYGDQRAREARAAALEEVKRRISNLGSLHRDGRISRGAAMGACDAALAAAPPQSEGGSQ